MSWTKSSVGEKNNVLLMTETYTLPASATTEYSTVIKEIGPKFSKENRYVTFVFNPSAVTGVNLDIALYGSDTEAGTTKFLLKDVIVADLTVTGAVAGVVDLNAYPAGYYFLAWTSDVNESANTIDVKVLA